MENFNDPSGIDNTFNRLKKLQALVKKESALKELCNQLYI